MNRQELVEKLIEKTGDKKAEKVLNAFIQTVKEAVSEGDAVRLVGFGSFERRVRSARTARNPINGNSLEIPEKKVPVFKAGKDFKEKVNK